MLGLKLDHVSKKGHRWVPTYADEIKVFIGMNILMALHSLPDLDAYWSMNDRLRVDGIAKIMPKHRYKTINQYLHLKIAFSSSGGTPPSYRTLPWPDLSCADWCTGAGKSSMTAFLKPNHTGREGCYSTQKMCATRQYGLERNTVYRQTDIFALMMGPMTLTVQLQHGVKGLLRVWIRQRWTTCHHLMEFLHTTCCQYRQMTQDMTGNYGKLCILIFNKLNSRFCIWLWPGIICGILLNIFQHMRAHFEMVKPYAFFPSHFPYNYIRTSNPCIIIAVISSHNDIDADVPFCVERRSNLVLSTISW